MKYDIIASPTELAAKHGFGTLYLAKGREMTDAELLVFRCENPDVLVEPSKPPTVGDDSQ